MSTEIKVVETIRGKELAEVLERLSKSSVGVKFKLMLDTGGALTELTVTTRDEKASATTLRATATAWA